MGRGSRTGLATGVHWMMGPRLSSDGLRRRGGDVSRRRWRMRMRMVCSRMMRREIGPSTGTEPGAESGIGIGRARMEYVDDDVVVDANMPETGMAAETTATTKTSSPGV